MWEDWNNILHSQGTTIHQYETQIIDQEITKTTTTVPTRTPSIRDQHLFQVTLAIRLLESTINQKRCWLTTVWAAQGARQMLSDDRDEHAITLFHRWEAPSKILTPL